MIKINLLGDETAVDHSGFFALVGFGASVAVVAVGCCLWFSSLTSHVDSLTQESSSLERELASLKEVTKEVRDLETKKKELTEKTSVIAVLKMNKVGPVRVLDDMNNAIPEKSWLIDFKEASGSMKVTGMAIDDQTVADFMRGLEKSNYFQRVDLGESRQEVKAGVPLKAFTLQVAVDYAGRKGAPSPSEAKDATGGGPGTGKGGAKKPA